MASKPGQAFLSKELATLDAQVPLEAVLDDLVFPEPDREKLFALFNELEFRKFAQEYAPLDAVPQEPHRRFEDLGGGIAMKANLFLLLMI